MRIKVYYQIKCRCGWPLMMRSIIPSNGPAITEYYCRRCKFTKLIFYHAHILHLKERCGSWEATRQLYDSERMINNGSNRIKI